MLDTITTLVPTIVASINPTPIEVPDSGVTALLLSGAVLSLGLIARFVKTRK